MPTIPMHKRNVHTEGEVRIRRPIIQARKQLRFCREANRTRDFKKNSAQNKTSQTLFESRDVC